MRLASINVSTTGYGTRHNITRRSLALRARFLKSGLASSYRFPLGIRRFLRSLIVKEESHETSPYLDIGAEVQGRTGASERKSASVDWGWDNVSFGQIPSRLPDPGILQHRPAFPASPAFLTSLVLPM